MKRYAWLVVVCLILNGYNNRVNANEFSQDTHTPNKEDKQMTTKEIREFLITNCMGDTFTKNAILHGLPDGDRFMFNRPNEISIETMIQIGFHKEKGWKSSQHGETGWIHNEPVIVIPLSNKVVVKKCEERVRLVAPHLFVDDVKATPKK
jgi:hypothetical protein